MITHKRLLFLFACLTFVLLVACEPLAPEQTPRYIVVTGETLASHAGTQHIEIGGDGANFWLTLLGVAVIFGVVNALVKPVIAILSCPLILLTLGLFYLVVNGLMLLLTDALAGERFEVDGIWWAILGGLVLGFVGSVLESLLGADERDEPPKVLPSGS